MNFLLTEKEKSRLKYVCRRLNISQSAFIRSAFLKKLQEELYFFNKNRISKPQENIGVVDNV